MNGRVYLHPLVLYIYALLLTLVFGWKTHMEFHVRGMRINCELLAPAAEYDIWMFA